jgi:hypothetical protein
MVAAWAAVVALVPPAEPTAPTARRDVRVIIPIYNDRGLRAVRSDLRPQLRRGDTFLIVSGNQDDGIDTAWVDQVAEEVRTLYPGTVILAGTSGMTNIRTAVAELQPPIEGVVYIYEPNFSNEPEFSWSFPATIARFEEVAEEAHAVGLRAIGKPTGRPLLAPALSGYEWDYATLGSLVDDLFVQTQSYCEDGVASFDEAIASLMTQFGGEAGVDRWVPQLTLDVSSEHGVDADRALLCAERALDQGVDRFLVWWSPPFAENAAAFLEALRP